MRGTSLANADLRNAPSLGYGVATFLSGENPGWTGLIVFTGGGRNTYYN
jgi:hypothetical protein